MRMIKLRPGRAPALSRGRCCAPDRRLSSGRHLPLYRGQSLRPRWNIPPAGVTFTRRHHRFTHVRPSHPGWPAATRGPESLTASRRSSPRPRPPGGTRTASALTPGFAPRSYPQRTPRRRQAIAHWPGYYTLDHISRPSNGASHLHSCTLTSHPAVGGLQHHLRRLTRPADHRPQTLHVIDDPDRLQHLPRRRCAHQHGAPTMQVDTHDLLARVPFHQGPPSS